MKKTIIASLFAIAISPALAQAADGTLSFTGNVSDNTCTLTSGTNGTQIIEMPTVNIASLARENDVAGLRTFTVTLGNCGNTARLVRLDFGEAGSTVDTTTGRLINTARPNSNVQIALLDGHTATTPMRLGTPAAQTTGATTSGGTVSIPLAAQYVATGGAATAGAVASTIRFTIAYP